MMKTIPNYKSLLMIKMELFLLRMIFKENLEMNLVQLLEKISSIKEEKESSQLWLWIMMEISSPNILSPLPIKRKTKKWLRNYKKEDSVSWMSRVKWLELSQFLLKFSEQLFSNKNFMKWLIKMEREKGSLLLSMKMEKF